MIELEKGKCSYLEAMEDLMEGSRDWGAKLRSIAEEAGIPSTCYHDTGCQNDDRERPHGTACKGKCCAAMLYCVNHDTGGYHRQALQFGCAECETPCDMVKKVVELYG